MKLTRFLAVVSVAAAAYFRFLRSPILTWGATDSEAGARLAGDELLEDADGVSTRAVDIDAPASAVWPWIAQMGPAPRGGAYTYDWIENLLGLDMHSVDRVLPEFQHPQIGDTIGYGPNRMRLERIEPDHVLAWRSEDGNWVWAFRLDEHDGSTRLISRNRFRLPTLSSRLGMLRLSSWSARCVRASRSERSSSRRNPVSLAMCRMFPRSRLLVSPRPMREVSGRSTLSISGSSRARCSGTSAQMEQARARRSVSSSA